tara:strand:+ start:5099 stop:5542 length:444 start_codon:yes stop_codon:yes gene_type:complete
MKLKSLLNEAVEWPEGYFEVTNRFEIGGGAWRMTFLKGQLIKVENTKRFQGVSQKMFRWDPLKQDYVPKSPPMSGSSDGSFGLGGFQDRDAQSWVDALVKNSKNIGEAQAKIIAKSMAKEKTLKARAAIKMLQDLPSNQMVKITMIG